MTEPVVTTGRWIGPTERPLLAWVTNPPAGGSLGGALILPPLGYEYQSTHRTLRTLAEALARTGVTALRLDYDGTGDSAGDQSDADRLAAWRGSVAVGVDALRRAGHADVSVIGLRFGATAALLEGARVNVSRVVAWAPVVSGRRHVRELRMLGMSPEPRDESSEPGPITHGGFGFDATTLDDLAAVDLEHLDVCPAPSVLFIERPDRPPLAALADHLRGLGSAVDVRAIDGAQQCLDQPAEYATVPEEIVREICDWIVAAQSSSVAPAPAAVGETPCVRADFEYEGAPIFEIVTRLSPTELVGIVGSPAESTTPPATVVWANSGSDTHIGPGRAWVEYSRRLNRAGFRTIRLDCRGWGESPDDDDAPARPYDARMATDLRDVVDEVEARGWGPVVLAGLCAGAWMTLNVARSTPLGGVIALNPQLYWQPGDPREATMGETHERRAAERRRLKRFSRMRIWWLLDVLGRHNMAARVLDDISARKTPTLLLFSRGDDGLEYLHDRGSRALTRATRSGNVEVVELAHIDHGMQRAWQRHAVTDALLEFLDALVPVELSVER